MIQFTVQKGKFIKHCPCTPDVIPCGYYNLNLHTGCPYDCSYCILQAYLETTEPVFFTNFGDMEKELVEVSQTQKYLRIGTGELTDSLALDLQTGYAHKILGIFEKFPGIVFEFKTKSANVENLVNYKKPPKNIVVSWSLNPREFIEREERLAPGLSLRLEAISKVQAYGYKIGIHFDPIVIFAGWQSAYLELVREIARIIEPPRIAWWSLGALRFPYALREHIFKHRDSRLFEGELVKGHDGKYRYFKPLRLELFHYLKKIIQENVSQETPLYLCMEDQEVWQEIFPGFDATEEAVNQYLYESAIDIIG
ncbi:MAG: radical SAM protein [Acidobacteria bacterium]|jgi:spore photoproduct lyase|nr:radical SAM protein [Acidobacteriota bacterium]